MGQRVGVLHSRPRQGGGKSKATGAGVGIGTAARPDRPRHLRAPEGQPHGGKVAVIEGAAGESGQGLGRLFPFGGR